MALKEFVIFSSLVAISIINSNILGSEAVVPPKSYMDQQYTQMKRDLYDMVERLFNLMSDVQKLQDMQSEYLESDVDFSAVARASKEVTQTQNQLISKVMQYILDSDAYLPGYKYIYPDLGNPNSPYNPNFVTPVMVP